MADLMFRTVSSNFHFYTKRLFIFAAQVTLQSLVFLVCRVIARGARIERRTNTHTQTRTVTLAAHARRGLKSLPDVRLGWCSPITGAAHTVIPIQRQHAHKIAVQISKEDAFRFRKRRGRGDTRRRGSS